MRNNVVESIRNNRVVVISGATGSGKTTQVPNYILEEAWAQEQHCNIVCTQPRRISAIGVAERVAAERGENIQRQPGIVGYQIRLERRASDRTRLLFCTTGVLLRRLQLEPDLLGVTHIVLDEVHERSIDSDFLIVILRDLLVRRTDLRVVLMSATLNAESFAQYFSDAMGGVHVPVIHIPGRTFEVKDFYLEDAVQWTGCVDLSAEGPGGRSKPRRFGGRQSRGESEKAAAAERQAKLQLAQELEARGDLSPETIRAVSQEFNEDEIPLVLIHALLEKIDLDYPLTDDQSDGHAVLIFLPGWEDIRKLHELLDKNNQGKKWLLCPLHGSMGTAAQRSIFSRPPRGTRKIVISTNIAESSITIDDVAFVIDSVKHKEKTYDEEADISCLLPTLVSKASAMQRRGRAGRVRAGVCWHLIPKPTYESALNDYALPEIVRTPLDQLCLQVKALDLAEPRVGGILDFLGKALTPPPGQIR